MHESCLTQMQTLYAGVQATLHNAHFKHPDGEGARWSMEDFLPGGRKPQSAEDKVAAFKAMIEGRRSKIADLERRKSPAEEAIPAIVRERAAQMTNAIAGEAVRRGVKPGDAIAGESIPRGVRPNGR